MTNAFLALAMFMCAALIDFAYARQTIATTNGQAFVSANWRALSYSLGCFGWLVAIKIGVWLLPFELAGLYLGTLVGVDKKPAGKKDRSYSCVGTCGRLPGCCGVRGRRSRSLPPVSG